MNRNRSLVSIAFFLFFGATATCAGDAPEMAIVRDRVNIACSGKIDSQEGDACTLYCPDGKKVQGKCVNDGASLLSCEGQCSMRLSRRELLNRRLSSLE